MTARKRITLTRSYDATLDEVWELWTTREGIESWWGPDGFSVKVKKLELRPGGVMLYAMSATAPEQVEFMKKAGMPTTTETSITFTEVTPRARLGYLNRADFIPGVEPYDVAQLVEFLEEAKGVRLRLTFDAMHDEIWTQRMTAGWEEQLQKLSRTLAA
jgi:uncharacterized protein YndB with AHSA1/START domain